jgi:hypothetical protein
MEAERLKEELTLLRTAYPDLEDRSVDGVHWGRIPRYAVPDGWSMQAIEIVFQFPAQAGQAPYAFYVRPALLLANGNQATNYTPTAVTPWGDDFAQFSWSPVEPWVPKANIGEGANMLNFVRSFADRFEDRQ